MPKPNPEELKKTLREVEARWQASDEAKEYSLGYVPGPTEHSLATREMLAYSSHQHFLATAAVAAPRYATSLDWRNHNGHNYITPIKDQGSCGSCVAFSCVATVEANVRVQKNEPALTIDLSEADLFFCHDGQAAPSCSTGWWVSPALTVFEQYRVPDEKCFPYTGHDQPCKRCADWKKRVTKIKSFQAITSPASMKAWLAKYGPLVTVFSIYEDFFSYHSGIYHHVSGALVGGDSVCCVGYNDARRFWICKNSWSIAWGEHGFFCIAYGQCGIDAEMWGVQI